MGSYMSMFESHAGPVQGRALASIEAAAAELSVNLFVTGPAVRNMLVGAPLRDLDVVTEGDFAALAGMVAERAEARIVRSDPLRMESELVFEGGVRVLIASARREKYGKPGSRPQVETASIHDHLRSLDFTINSMAISATRASRGLLLDPNNGLADITARELRAISAHTFDERPICLFRLIRLQVSLGFGVEAKTRQHYEAARAAGLDALVSPEQLLSELVETAKEQDPLAVLRAWEAEGLLSRFSPAIAGRGLNAAGFERLMKARATIPFGSNILVDEVALFLWTLTAKLTPRERSQLIAATAMPEDMVASWKKLDAKSAKVEAQLMSPAVRKPSHVWRVLSRVPAEQALVLLIRPAHRTARERVRNYFARYATVAQEFGPDIESATEAIARRLDAKPKSEVKGATSR